MSAARTKNNVLRFNRPHPKNGAEGQAHADSACANCGSELQGHFCHGCGQSAHVHHSLLHLIEEVVHGLWHFDAKGWRTIPLLIAFPGELTRRYIDGQRVRFISPLGLFLFMVFLMFFAFSFSTSTAINFSDSAGNAQVKQELKTGQQKLIADARLEVTQAQAELEAAKKSHGDVAAKQSELDTALAEQKALETGLVNAEKIAAQIAAHDLAAAPVDGSVTLFGQKKDLHKVLQHALDNKDLVAYKMKNNAYKFALVLVPVSLPFLWLMFFWRRNITLFDHAVFSLYSLSFMALLFALLSVLLTLEMSGIAVALALIVPPVHMYRQLKGTYQLTHLQTVWRTAVLALCACTMVLLFFVFVAALSAV